MSSKLGFCKYTKRRLMRRKVPPEDDTPLNRVLNACDLTGLGVGSTLGLGVYVLAGSVAYGIAGPAVMLSFIVAAIASLCAGLCYAEFAAKVPRAGSAYAYSYATIGEFVGFTIGWNLVLEYVVGTASVGRGLTSYIDALTNHTLSQSLAKLMPYNIPYVSSYLDVISFTLIILLTIILALGVHESVLLHNVMTMWNLLTILIVVISGYTKCNFDNWNIPAAEVPKGHGSGGFMPYGLMGVIVGAAKCFFGFIGFDCIATTGEESKNPKRDMPIAILASLFIVLTVYLGISSVLTLMMPYFKIDEVAPLAYAFEYVNMNLIKWCVTIGAIVALCTSLLGAMFPLPRVLYAMAQDEVIFKSFAYVHPWTKTPLISTIFAGISAALIAMFFDLDKLIELGTIGTLLAYTIVAVGVLIMHYEDSTDNTNKDADEVETQFNFFLLLQQLYNGPRYKQSNTISEKVANFFLILFLMFCILFCILSRVLDFKQQYTKILLGVITGMMLFCILIMFMQPQAIYFPGFKAPCVPFIPCITIFINTLLMLQFTVFTWVGYSIWIVLGYVIYFTTLTLNFQRALLKVNSLKTLMYFYDLLEPD